MSDNGDIGLTECFIEREKELKNWIYFLKIIKRRRERLREMNVF